MDGAAGGAATPPAVCYPARVRTSDFDYDLPPDRIAQTPVEPRDSARLMVVERGGRELSHHHFRELPMLLEPGDLLVANDSRVIPARLHGHKAATGGAVELLLLRPEDSSTWQCLVRGRVRVGTILSFRKGNETLSAEVVELRASGVRRIRFERPVAPLLGQLGEVPLPPYIHEPLSDAERYQTVYARVAGSAAAPTAGLHFTPLLIERLTARGVRFAFVTLHVGLDTFRPVEVEDISEHKIHREWASVPETTLEQVAAARARGGRVVAVGTTSVRALESVRDLQPFEGWTDVFITPGFEFQLVDAMITNFHLPRSTLLMLVAAFAGKETMDRAYHEAIRGDYRFYSFGDAMLIL